MNHTSHINHINVVHVKCTSSYGGGKRGSCEPQKTHEPQMGPPCVFVVHVNHKKHMVNLFVVHVVFWVHMNHVCLHHMKACTSHEPR